MYMDLNGNTLGTMIINNSGLFSVFARDNFTLLGNLYINAGGKLESMSSAGDITLNGSSFINNGTFDLNASEMKFTGGNNVECGEITSSGAGNLVLTKTASTNTVTTTGDLDLNSFTLNEGKLLVDGEDVTFDYSSFIHAGATLQLTSGLIYFSGTAGNSIKVQNGTLDVDGGELKIGNPSQSYGDIMLSSTYGSSVVDISGGVVNIADEFKMYAGTLNMSGGTLSIFNNTGSGNGSAGRKFYVNNNSTINLLGGSLILNGQKSTTGTSDAAMFIGSGATSNITSGCAIICQGQGLNDENMYLELNGHTLPNLLVNLTGYEVINRNNLSIVGDLIVMNGTFDVVNTTVSVGGTSDINGILKINSGNFIANGTFDAYGGDIDFTNASGELKVNAATISFGALDELMGTVEYGGSSAQSISENETFYSLTVNNSSGLVLNANAIVKGTLGLSSGLINPTTKTLTIYSSSAGSPSSHVDGPVTLNASSYTSGSIEVPTGDGTVYRPVFLQPEAAGATTYKVEYYDASHSSVNQAIYPGAAAVGAGVHHIAAGYWWDVDRVGSTKAKVGFNWDINVNASQTGNVTAVQEMLVVHWTGTQWENVMGSNNVATGSPIAGSVTSDYMDNFSPFGEGSSGSGNPLPVDLLSFNATCSHDIVDVYFTVLSQINNDYFLVERSADAVNWEVIGNVDGAGNNNTQMDYNFVDMHPLATQGYYRLTQVDFDAKSETFWPVITECSTNNTGLDISVYPNPILDHFTIEIDLDEYQGDDVYYTILDIRGSIVKEEQISLTRGFNKHEIQIEDLSTGAYMLRFTNTKNHIKEQRIMVK